MEIRVARDNDKEKWDQLVNSCDHGTIFHTWEWTKLMERHSILNKFGAKTKGRLYPLLIENGEELIGLIPIYLFKHPLLKLVYSPSRTVETIYLGPLLTIPKTTSNHRQQELQHRFVECIHGYLTNQLKAQFITIQTPPGFNDTRTFGWLHYRISPNYTYFIDLKQGEKQIWNGFTKNIRQEIQKCEKLGITIKTGGKEEYIKILNLLENRERLRMTYNFFQDAFQVSHPKEMKVVYAEKGDKLLSGLILLHHNKRIYCWVGTPRSLYEGAPPNDLIYWESLKWGLNEGFTTFEIMGADDLILFPFKRKFNPVLKHFYTMVWMTPTISRILGATKGYLA